MLTTSCQKSSRHPRFTFLWSYHSQYCIYTFRQSCYLSLLRSILANRQSREVLSSLNLPIKTSPKAWQYVWYCPIQRIEINQLHKDNILVVNKSIWKTIWEMFSVALYRSKQWDIVGHSPPFQLDCLHQAQVPSPCGSKPPASKAQLK